MLGWEEVLPKEPEEFDETEEDTVLMEYESMMPESKPPVSIQREYQDVGHICCVSSLRGERLTKYA